MTYPELLAAVSRADVDAVLHAADEIRVREERWWIEQLVRCCANARTLAQVHPDPATVLACDTVVHTIELLLFEALRRAH